MCWKSMSPRISDRCATSSLPARVCAWAHTTSAGTRLQCLALGMLVAPLAVLLWHFAIKRSSATLLHSIPSYFDIL